METERFVELETKGKLLAAAAARRHNLDNAKKSILAMAMKEAEAARMVNCGLDLRPEAVYTMLTSSPETMD